MTDTKRTGSLLEDAAQAAKRKPMTDTCARCSQTIGHDCGCTEMERMTAERDHYKARAEWAEKALDGFNPHKIGFAQSLDHDALQAAWAEAKRILAQIDAEPAEPITRDDHALALVAAEREACAEKMQRIENILGGILSRLDDALTPQDCGLTMHAMGQTPDWFVEAAYATCYSAREIRARTDDDAQAALERRDARIKQKARNEALRKAFNTLRAYAPHEVDGPEHDVGYASGYATAQNRILALITEDQSDDG